MSKYSGIPLDEKRTWIVPRWVKEVFVALSFVSVAGIGISKTVQHFGGKVERAKSSVEADEIAAAAPPLKLPAKAGTLDLQSFKGKVVLVNFWATWCPPCRDELPSLTRLAQSYDPKSFVVLAVSEDEGWGPVDSFLGKEAPFTLALDEGQKVAHVWGTSKYPESYLVDASGTVRLKFVGPRDWADPNMSTVIESYGAKRLTRG